MHIKTVKEYLVSYCYLIITDNHIDVACICDPDGIVPVEGMEIKQLNRRKRRV